MQDPFLFDPDDAKGPVLRPKDAAALILVRRKGDALRVLMGERSARHTFLPGRFVFPGGRLDIADQRLLVDTDLRPEVRVKVAAGTTTSRARGLALAAVRETFEETGILIGRKHETALAHPFRRVAELLRAGRDAAPRIAGFRCACDHAAGAAAPL